MKLMMVKQRQMSLNLSQTRDTVSCCAAFIPTLRDTGSPQLAVLSASTLQVTCTDS